MTYTRTTWADNSAPYITAANLNNIETALVDLDTRDVFKLKASDQTVNASTTLVDDAELASMTLGVGTWVMDAMYLTSGTAAGDIKIAWAHNGTFTGYRGGIGPTDTTTSVISTTAATTVGVNRAAAAANTAATITASTPYGVDGTNWSTILESGVLVVTVSGTFKVQWAQLAASGSTVMRAGSYIWARKVA